jgi:hypothetical protein
MYPQRLLPVNTIVSAEPLAVWKTWPLRSSWPFSIISTAGPPVVVYGYKRAGEWRDGHQNGRGTLTRHGGETYVGNFEDDDFNGLGTYTWPDGRKYVGNFKDDEFNGQGTFTFADGSEYMGEWRDGRRNGQGTLTLSDGAKYIGAWQASKKHGQGKQYSSTGELVHEGYWISDEYYGPKPPCAEAGLHC